MDRDPNDLIQLLRKNPRIVVLGDALHSMTPFKGQGANQALQDGPLLADWLQKASVDSAVTGCMREAVQRTAPVVQASRLAAQELHSSVVLEQPQSFAGVRPEFLKEFLSTLKERNIGAALGGGLDGAVAELIQELGVGAVEPGRKVAVTQQVAALQFSYVGDTQGLRKLSLQKHSESIRTAKDAEGRTCLHLAAIGGHKSTCKWLLTEVGCESKALDKCGKTPMDYAKENDNVATLAIIQLASR